MKKHLALGALAAFGALAYAESASAHARVSPPVALAKEGQVFTLGVRQTYSDGTVVDWSGPESSDTPAPVVKSVSSLGGGGSSTLAIVAVAIAAVALLLSLGGLLVRGGRPLT